MKPKVTAKKTKKQLREEAAIEKARDFAIRFGKKYKGLLTKLAYE